MIDVTTLEPFSKIVCPQCGGAVRVRRKFDHFSIVQQIGEGGMSRVFDAQDATLGRHVALKILNRKYSRDSVRTAGFEREAQLTAAVMHPNVIKLYSAGRDQGNFYLAMELVGGGSLEQRITEKGRLSEKEVLAVGRAAAEGLRAAYRVGLIHRDVKPANILFTEDDTPKIVDFGLALFHAQDVDESGEIWATPYYVAPEKVREDREDFRSDMYSLGATLYHALVGKPPYQANTNSIQELKIIKSRPVRLEDSGLKFSQRTCEIINRMLALNPDERHATYDALVEHFRDAESFLGYSVIGKRSRRQRIIYATVGGLVSLVLLGILIRPADKPKPRSLDFGPVETVTQLNDLGKTLATGAKTVSDTFHTGRSTLLEGRYKEARKIFDELIQWNKTKQPTLNWARVNAALCAIVAGDKDDAVKYFRHVLNDKDGGTGVSVANMSDFFQKLGTNMSNGLGLQMKPGDVQYKKDNEEALGYLLQGLAAWNFGDPKLALDWFQAFETASPAKGLEWIGGYKTLVSPYMNDAKLVDSTLQNKALDFASVEDARKALNEVKAVLPKLKTEGVAQKLVKNRVRGIEDQIQNMQKMALQSEQTRLDGMRQREVTQMRELAESLPAMVHGYNFTNIVELLEGMAFETPEVKSALANRLYIWSKAKEFMDTLQADVNAKGYMGVLPRKTGAPLQGKLVKLDYENATLAFEKGQFLVPADSLTPEALLSMAQAFNDTVTDSTDFYRRQELMVVFAKAQGLDHTAEVMAGQLMEENRAFRVRWARVEQAGL